MFQRQLPQGCLLSKATPEVLVIAERISEIGTYQQKWKLVNQPDVRNGLSIV